MTGDELQILKGPVGAVSGIFGLSRARPSLSRFTEDVPHAPRHRRGQIDGHFLRQAGELTGLFAECLTLLTSMFRRKFDELGR